MTDQLKVCTRCHEAKLFTEYGKQTSKKDGLCPHCKVCQRIRHKQWECPAPTESRKQSMRAAGNRYRQKNKARQKIRSAEYYKKHPEIAFIGNHTARAKKYGCDGKFTFAEWQALCAKFGNKCASCGASEKLVVDHVIPLILKGANTIDNIQPLCAKCNRKKYNKTTDYRPRKPAGEEDTK